MTICGDFSLIVPCYNYGIYLRDLISSVYGGETCLGKMEEQTLLPREIIISDDASTDNTTVIVIELMEQYPNIRYRRNVVNSGTPVTCNEAIRIASSTYITRIDADDMRESWSFQEMFELQKLNPHSMIFDDVMIFANGIRKGKSWKMPEYYFWDLLSFNTIHAGIMFPKQAWIDCKGYPEEFKNGRDDWSFNVALGVAGYCGVHLAKPGYLYRREKQNRSIRNGHRQEEFATQMRMHFSEIYSGRFEMPGCCGGRGNKMSKSSSQGSMSQQAMVGAVGMTLVTYMGENMGTMAFFGPSTGVAYRFSARNRTRNVDNRDLHFNKDRGLLDLYEYGKPVFKLYSQQEPVISPIVSPEQQIETAVRKLDEENQTVAVVIEVTEEIKTPIETGQEKGIGKVSVEKLAVSGITTWEQFFATPNDVLFGIIGISIMRIEEIKKDLLTDE